MPNQIDTSMYNEPLVDPTQGFYRGAEAVAKIQGERQQRQLREQERQMNALKLQEVQRSITDDQNARNLPENSTVDDLIRTVGPDRAYKIVQEKHLATKADYEQKAQAIELWNKRVDRLAKRSALIHDQASYEQNIAESYRDGDLTEEQIKSLPPQYDPKAIEAFRMQALSSKDQLAEARAQIEHGWKQAEQEHATVMRPLLERKAAADAKTAEQQATGTQPLTEYQRKTLERQGLPNTPTELSIAANDPKRTPEERLMARSALKDLEKHAIASRPVTNVSMGGQDAGALNQDDYKRAGAEYAITGQMPPLGNGSGPVKQRIIHEKMEFARNSGLGPRDMALAGAAFKGDSKSLAQFQTQRDQIVSFEQTAQKNLDLFINAASKIPDTGVPWLNRPIRELDEKVVGSANMAAVNAARQVANNEIAKVTSGGGLSGVLSDSARHEVESYNPKSATLGQTLAVAKALKQDMANRHKSMDDTLSAIRGRIGTFGNTPAEPGGASAPGGMPKVSTKADYDKLPSGASYIDAQDGKQYRKR